MTNVTGGPSLEELAPGVTELIARWCGWTRTEGRRGPSAEKLSQGQWLLRYAEEEAEPFHDPDGVAYATVELDGHKETYPVKSNRFRDWLLMRFYREHGKAPSAWATTDALNTIRAKALFDGPEIEVYVRIAEHEGNIYVDLSNDRWEAVKVTRQGYSVVQNPPIKFIRKRGAAPLPYPVGGSSVDELRRFLNVETEDEFRLVVAWIVFSLSPNGPYAILVVQGEQGSAKSTTVRVVRMLVDPAVELLRTLPHNERDLAIAASNAWVLAFDNLSGIPNRVSDAICRIATGGGFATRELYSDDEEIIFSTKRPVILNGIDDIIIRGDLQERSVLVSLPSIPKEERREEREFWADFEAARPEIFGALLSTLSGVLRHVDDVVLKQKPRMADFAIWGTAAETALGWEPGAFIRAYTGNQEEANDVLLSNEPLAGAVQRLLEHRGITTKKKQEWSGTATELLSSLGGFVDEDIRRSNSWPKGPQVLSRRMRRIAPALRSIEIEYSEDEVGHGKRKVKTLRKIDNQGEESSQDGAPADERPEGDGGEASGTTSEASEEADYDNPFNFDFGD